MTLSNSNNKFYGTDRRLTDLRNALYVTTDDLIAVRTGIEGNIIISGDVNIPGIITVNSSPEDPVHTHITEVGTSGILNVPYLPVEGTVYQGTTPWQVSKDLNPNSATNGIFVKIINEVIGIQDNGGSITIDGTVSIDSLPEVEIKNDLNNPIPISKNTNINSDSNPIWVKGTSDTSFFDPTQSDAFGRLRTSSPYTLFDSFHRYQDNGISSIYTASGGASSHDANSSVISMTVNQNIGSKVYRESSRVFAYQPGKSLQIFTTFVMNTPKTNLRQRIGYFGTSNGIFLEQNSGTLYLVRRTKSYGTVQEYRVAQSSWNVNTLISNGTSTLFVDRSQIFWMDIEWLGVGSVRCGFVINGELIHCHTFNHANQIDPITSVGLNTTYMGTACLPLRCEIENTGETVSNSIFKLICSTVISEGGYNEVGRTRSVGHAINAAYSLLNPNTLYPIFSMRLKSTRLDGLVLPKSFSIAAGGNVNYRYIIVKNGTTSGGTWIDAGINDSSVEYNLTATSITGGNIVDMSYIISSNQASSSSSSIDFPFKYQLERNSFTNTSYEYTICVESTGNNISTWASVVWEETT